MPKSNPVVAGELAEARAHIRCPEAVSPVEGRGPRERVLVRRVEGLGDCFPYPNSNASHIKIAGVILLPRAEKKLRSAMRWVARFASDLRQACTLNRRLDCGPQVVSWSSVFVHLTQQIFNKPHQSCHFCGGEYP